MQKITLMTLAAVAMGLSACSKSEDTPSAALTPANLLAEGLTAVSAGMGSSMDSGGGDLAAASFKMHRKIGPLDADVDEICADTGYAFGNGDTGAPAGAPNANTAEYAARNAYCNLRMSPRGPDTVRGALDRVKGFLCAVGNVTYDGVARTKTIKISTACFSESFASEAASGGFTSVVVTVTGYADPTDMGGSADYDKGIEIDLSAVGNGSYFIQHTITDDKFTASMLSKNDDDEDQWIMNTVFDRSDADESVLRLEGRFNGNNDDPQGRRYVRANVRGPTSGEEFGNPDLVEFILFDISASDGDEDEPDNITYNTLRGNAADGYRVWNASETTSDVHANLYLAAGWDQEDTGCFGDGACTGNAGLVIDDLAKNDFAKSAYSVNATEYKSMTTMFSEAAELTFDSLSFEAQLD